MNFIRNLSVRFKLFAITGTFVAGIIGYAVFALITLHKVMVNGPLYEQINQGNSLVSDIVPPNESLMEAYSVCNQIALETSQPQIHKLADHLKDLKEGDGGYDQLHKHYAQTLPEGEIKNDVVAKSYEPAEQFWNIVDSDFLDRAYAGDSINTRKILSVQLKPLYDANQSAIADAVTLATDANTRTEQSAMQIIRMRTLMLNGLGAVVILIGSIATVVIGRMIIRPLLQTVTLLENVAGGDLTQMLDVKGHDEVGRMGYALNTTITNLRESIGGIAQNSQLLAKSSTELTAVSQQMSTNAEETSAQAGVVSSASDEVSKNVRTVAVAGEEMSASIREISKNACDAARIATNAVQIVQATNATISKLGDSSHQIGNVVKMITGIAQQTNLLALNATIEAARAGEAGKGFAVVANEVKELAKDTTKATEEIGAKIAAIQADTQGAVMAIGQILTVITQVNDISNTIASAVEEQTATTSEMGRNISEAARGTAEIATNITGVAAAAQSTSGGAVQTQAASSELSKMAANLQKLVSRFRFVDSAMPEAKREPNSAAAFSAGGGEYLHRAAA